MDYNSFNYNIERLKKCYEVYPETTCNELEQLVNRLEGFSYENKKSLLRGIDLIWLSRALFVIAILLLGIVNITKGEAFMYYFASLFFFAGLFVGLSIPGFGLIFLLSHGGIGLGLMIIPVVNAILKSPILSEEIGNSIYFSLYTALFTLIVAVLSTILYNLSPNFQNKKYSLPTILFLYFITIAIIQFIPIIYNIPIEIAI